MWESDESEDSLDWNTEDYNKDGDINPSNASPIVQSINEATENWDSDVNDSDTKLVSYQSDMNYSSDVCWNTVGDNDTCRYWDGKDDRESENAQTGDICAENDDDDCSEDFCCFKLTEQSAKVMEDEDSSAEMCDLEDDGLIWITSEETTPKITNDPSNPT